MRTMIFWSVLVVMCMGCEEKIKPSVHPELVGKTLPHQESWNSSITISDSGIVKAIINAGYIRVYEEPRRTLLSDGVVVDFYSDEGVKTSVLNSVEASVNDLTNDLEAWRNVVVVSESDSTVLRTERLFWDNRRGLIHTPEFVRIVSPHEKIQGTGFEAEQNLKNYRIFKVSGEAQTQ
ncbi:MAG: LPS export ABC transporter periplasmic protein LptC [Bacteroidota bacterium]